MKKKILVCMIAIAVFSMLMVACTRSASGSPSDTTKAESTLPNPVSTQSQLMKDIIAGTQTAMAMPLDATAVQGTKEASGGDEDEITTEGTPAPKAEPTSAPLPTSTSGPPPTVELSYNNNLCELSACEAIGAQLICCCTIENSKDNYVTVQVSNMFFTKGTNLEFYMAPEGEYDSSKYILAGTAKYAPTDKGVYFTAKVNIPDSLRGTASIYVEVDTENPEVFAQTYFANQ